MDKSKFQKPPEPDKPKQPFDPAEALLKYRINPQDELIEEPVLLTINGAIIATLINFSLWIGKAKSRKTFLITSLTSAAASGYCSIDGIKGTVRPSNKILYFDTEQSPFHAQRTVKRICKQIGIDQPVNFEAFGLRPLEPVERWATIDHAIKNTPGLALVVIDGIADLLSHGINDEEEAIKLITALLRWTTEYKIHIITVLHQNKGDFNARGHIGTYLQHKAETIISVNKDQKNRDISIVKADYCRDKDFQDFAFTINDDGLPTLAEANGPETPALLQQKKTFEEILPPPRTMTRGLLVIEYMARTGKKERTAQNHITNGINNQLLVYDQPTKSYKLNKLLNDEEPPF